MRKVVRIPLLGVGTLGALALASGFPARLGLTRAQVLVSMPGDLVLPTATLKADRVATLPGTPEDVWPLAHDVVATYEDLWGQPLDVVYEEVPNLLVVATNKPSEDAIDASLAIRFNCGADQTTTMHVRERYLTNGWRERAEALVAIGKTYAAATVGLLRATRALSVSPEANDLR